MHQSSLDKMTLFRDRYLASRRCEHLTLMDLGSQDINGSYRPIFSERTWNYIGLDMVAGNNVDIILRSPYHWKEIATKSADIVISGQAFEHIRYFWITMLEINRVLRPGGMCCILAPSSGPEHRYPVDCWRIYPDGMISLAEFAQLEVLEVSTQWNDLGYTDESDSWHDSLLICRKPVQGFWSEIKGSIRRWIQHRVLISSIKPIQ